jgi:hypothetical protein
MSSDELAQWVVKNARIQESGVIERGHVNLDDLTNHLLARMAGARQFGALVMIALDSWRTPVIQAAVDAIPCTGADAVLTPGVPGERGWILKKTGIDYLTELAQSPILHPLIDLSFRAQAYARKRLERIKVAERLTPAVAEPSTVQGTEK